MSKNISILRSMLEQKISNATRLVNYGVIKSVDESSRTCVVTINEIDYNDVLLYSVEDDSLDGLVLVPKVGSTVMVSTVSQDRYYVSLYSELDKIIYTCHKVTVSMDKSGVDVLSDKSRVKVTSAGVIVERGSSGLKKTLSDLLSAIQQITVPTGVGPSGVPVNAADFAKIKKDLDNYLS